MAEELNWGAEAVDPSERSLPGLKARFLIDHAPSHGRVLEIGSGDGKNLRTLAAAMPELTLLGCDVREPRTPADCYEFFKIEDALPKPLRHTCDAVLVFDVLEHVPDPAATLDDALAALKPDGKLIAFVPVEGEPLSAYTFFKATLGRDVFVETKEHIQAFRHRELRALIESRFDVVEWHYAYHALGQFMDAGFFAAQRMSKLRDLWRRDNAYYNADKKDVGGAGGMMNQLLRLGNLLAWAESTALRDVRFASAGALFVGKAR